MRFFSVCCCSFPQAVYAEKILWEDDAGQVVLSDDGNVQFVSPGGEAAAEPIEENIDENTYAPDETPAPVEKSLPNDFTFRKTVKYGDSGELVAQIQAVWPSWGSTTPRYPAVIIR